MKLIVAVVRPRKLDAVVHAVTSAGAHGLTVMEVKGVGQEYGHVLKTEHDKGQAMLQPKIRLEVVVTDTDTEGVIEAIRNCADQGSIGDGKIWVLDVETVLRIRTGERGQTAA